ncbi:hypothetical protein ACLOJK_024980 [Asimina triloba]
MGSSFSQAAPPPPPPPPPPTVAGVVPHSPPDAKDAETKTEEKVDYMNLPCPIPFEEIQREALTESLQVTFVDAYVMVRKKMEGNADLLGVELSLKPELFEACEFSISVFMGAAEIPSQSAETIKVPTAHYEFGANYLDPKLMLIGRILTDGRLNARAKMDLTENLTLKINAQSVTPNLSLGSEAFWLGHQRKSGLGLAARYNTDKMVAAGQVASTGIIALSYVQKVSEKVSLATDLMYNHMTRDITTSVGYDYMLRQENSPQKQAVEALRGHTHTHARANMGQWILTDSFEIPTRNQFTLCRLRGKLDSNGCVAAFLEERLNMGVNFILSAESNFSEPSKLYTGPCFGDHKLFTWLCNGLKGPPIKSRQEQWKLSALGFTSLEVCPDSKFSTAVLDHLEPDWFGIERVKMNMLEVISTWVLQE